MSNIVKKITKKYKWLRFLNYKTTKLAVLSAALFGLCLSSGASFAKYRDENYGGGNAGAAKFGGGIVSFSNKTYSLANILPENNDYGVYAFVAEFSIDFSEIEVSANYKMNLKFGENEFSTYTNPGTIRYTDFVFQETDYGDTQSNVYTLSQQTDGSFSLVKNNNAVKTEIFGNTSTSLNPGNTYFAKKENGNFNWNYLNTYSNGELTFEGSVVSGNVETFKLVYFINIILEGNSTFAEDSYILYDLNIWQVN